MGATKRAPTLLHHRPAAEIADAQISPFSRWKDSVWRFERNLSGQEGAQSVFNWQIDVGQGRLLTDGEFSDLLDACKRLIWSLLVDRRYGKLLKPESAYTCFLGLKRLVPWMLANGYHSFDDLRAESSLEYVDDLRSEAIEAAKNLRADRESNKDDMIRALKVWPHLHQQRAALEPAGIRIFGRLPFEGRSAYDVAGELAEDAAQRVPPLPDEVAMPILAAAIRVVRHAAREVIDAQHRMVIAGQSAGRRNGMAPDTQAARRHAAAKRIAFGILPGETEPWHPPLVDGTTIKRHDRKKKIVRLDAVGTLRHLVMTTRDASVIVVQGLIGVRINELCSFKGGKNPTTGLPQCVEIERSLDGLTDIYYAKGKLTKGREAPTDARWVLGSRPVGHRENGDETLPLPVVALCVLDDLYQPWRDMADRDELIVSFSNSRKGFPGTADSIGPPRSQNLLRGMKDFVLNYVDLSALPDTNWRGEDLAIYRDTAGTVIRTHQWRKTFAHYVLLTRSNLLQAVSQHFKHLSLAMTEQGYLIDDPFLRGMLGEAALEATVDFFYRASNGEPLSGRLGDLVRDKRPELEDIAIGDEWTAKSNLRDWVLVHDFRIFHTEAGRCGIGIKPLDARCHEIAGTTHWANKEPNYETREPVVCVGCACFAIDRETSHFWVVRHRENVDIYAEAEAKGLAHEYLVAKRRAEQAAAIIKKLGISEAA